MKWQREENRKTRRNWDGSVGSQRKNGGYREEPWCVTQGGERDQREYTTQNMHRYPPTSTYVSSQSWFPRPLSSGVPILLHGRLGEHTQTGWRHKVNQARVGECSRAGKQKDKTEGGTLGNEDRKRLEGKPDALVAKRKGKKRKKKKKNEDRDF